jgi:hypothetical protein
MEEPTNTTEEPTNTPSEKITVVVVRKTLGNLCGFAYPNTCPWLAVDDVGTFHRCNLFASPLSSSTTNRFIIWRCDQCSLLKASPPTEL